MVSGLPKNIIKKYGVTKKAWQVFRGGKSRASSTRHSLKPKRRVVHIARRFRRSHRGGGKSMIRGFESASKGIALIAPAIAAATNSGLSGRGKVVTAVKYYTGYDIDGNKWSFSDLLTGYLPVVGVTIGWKGFHFINKMIRRL